MLFNFSAIDPPSNLAATQITSRAIRITWSKSPSEITGYKVDVIPMTSGAKKFSLSVGPQTTAFNIKELSADTEYQINVYAMKGLTASEPVTIMEKTQAVKVQVGKSSNGEIKYCVLIFALYKTIMVVGKVNLTHTWFLAGGPGGCQGDSKVFVAATHSTKLLMLPVLQSPPEG